MQVATLSSKGQIIIPKDVRRQHHWHVGCKFTVIDFDNGIILKPEKETKKADINELLGCMNYHGPRKSLRDMEKSIEKEAKKHK